MKSRVLLLCSVLGLCAPVGVAQAADTAAQIDGRTHFRRGVDFYREGDYRAAQIEFKRAYELAPNYKVLYNLGQTSLELQDYASALRSFERYLADGGKDIAPLRRTQIEGDIQKLEKRVARVELTTNVPDAEIFVDDVSVGKTPLSAPLAVSAGRRKISALKGGLTAIRVIELVGGDSAKVSLEIAEPVAPPPAATLPSASPDIPPAPRASESPRPVVVVPPPAPPPMNVASTRNSGLWVGVVVTGALATGAVVTGSLAFSAKKDFDRTIARYGVDPADVNDARNKTRTLALVGDILAGAALLSGGITVIAAVSSGGSSRENTSSVRLNVTPGGVLASGSF